MQFAFCGRCEVLREVWKHNLPTGSANGTAGFAVTTATCDGDLRTLPKHLCSRHEVLRALRYSDHKRAAGLARSEAG